MKKSLIALAVASAAMAGSAYAANVEVYGLIDTSLAYVYADPDAAGHDGEGKFTMENAREFGSRFGLRGSEDLGNGMKVGFVLESGIKSDSGELDQGGRLFGREAHINLTGDFGYLAFGLQPVFGSTLGQHGLFRAIDPLFANYTEAFGSGHASASMWTRVDNAISYVTPNWAGFNFYGMYSFENDSTKPYDRNADEGSSGVDRYAALAARYQQGALEMVAVYDTTMYGNDRQSAKYDDNGQTFTFGGNYTFAGGLKVLAFGQWFKDQELNRAGAMSDALKLNRGAAGGGGVAKAQVAYRDMENQLDQEFNRWTIAAAYDYPLSKRTAVYAMTGYTQESMEGQVNGNGAKYDADPKAYEFTVGMVHRF